MGRFWSRTFANIALIYDVKVACEVLKKHKLSNLLNLYLFDSKLKGKAFMNVYFFPMLTKSIVNDEITSALNSKFFQKN